MSKLALAEGLPALPDNAATQVFAWMGRRGSGKTYGAGRLVELLLERGIQVCVVDPVGTWWGLRFAADGKGPSGFDIPVFGGWHGDMALPPTSGKVLAEMVATRSTSIVLDVSEMTEGEQARFMADFGTELFQRKKRHRSPLHLVLEECQEFAPQNVPPEGARMVGAMQRIFKLGRNFGVGGSLLSQRPQDVNKKVLNQAEVMLGFQLTGVLERKALRDWVQQVDAGDREITDVLPGLATGRALIWSPGWLKHFGEHQLLKKRTYDASATPDGREQDAARKLPPIDLDELRAALEAAKVDVNVGDVDALQAEVSRLRRELTKAQASHVGRVIEKPVEVIPEAITQLAGVAAEQVENLRAHVVGLKSTIENLGKVRLRVVRGKPIKVNGKAVTQYQVPGIPDVDARIDNLARRATPARASFGGEFEDDHAGGAAPARMLRALASRHPDPCSKRQIAILAGVPARNSTFRGGMAALKKAGHITLGADDMVSLTPGGLEAAGGPGKPKSPGELLAMWKSQLTGKARDIVELMSLEPRAFKKREIADRVNVDVSLSTFRGYMAQLSLNDLIRKTSGGFIINPELAQ
jgi:uncharacterized protein